MSRIFALPPSLTNPPMRALPKSSFTALLLACAGTVFAGPPPYGDPNQPYDRLPGTLQTDHVSWAKPAAGGKLNVLFLIPYCNSREVVEAAQRLEMNTTVIMNAGYAVWENGFFEGPTATPLKGTEARVVLDELSHRRLSLANHYDAIVIAKLSWPVIPVDLRELVLQHVERGAGLVSVTPNRLKPGLKSREELTTPDAEFTKLFQTSTLPEAQGAVLRGLPLDVLPFHVLPSRSDFMELARVYRFDCTQSPLNVVATTRGKGRIVSVDYFDATVAYRRSASLSPHLAAPVDQPHAGDDFAIAYDYSFALLSRAIQFAAQHEGQAEASISWDAPKTELKAPVDETPSKYAWEIKTPAIVIARDDLAKSHAIFKATARGNASGKVTFAWSFRDLAGKTIVSEQSVAGAFSAKTNTTEVSIPLPMLARGSYLLDLRVLDATDAVIDFASSAFRVESAQNIASLSTEKNTFRDGDTIHGGITFARPLDAAQMVSLQAVDTWGRVVAHANVTIKPDRNAATFTLPVHLPLCRLWDLVAAIRGPDGVVDSSRTWITVPDWTFDDYMFMLIFSPTPGPCDWKGSLYGRVIRDYGVNATFTQLIASNVRQYEVNEREHLQSVTFAEHMGEVDPAMRIEKGELFERPDLDLAEIGRMARQVTATGLPLDVKAFPFKQFGLNANFINTRLDKYKESGRFGSPLYIITGENYLAHEFDARENSGFGPTTAKQFQDWCRAQYHGDLGALNAEWGSDLKSWDEVRGILLPDAVEKNQLPRWVDFRHFMRSDVWSQFFIDWTAMLRRFVPEARTGRVGHDHHDFTRYRDAMTGAKTYIGQEPNSEWRHAMMTELPQSFSGDKSFLLAPQSMIRWTYDFESPLNRERWPWQILFMGLNGFDWERGLPESLGGEFCFTPDMSEPLPYFLDISREVKFLENGIGKLTIGARPYRSKVAMLWSPVNHWISRLHPFQDNAFSGTGLYNVSVIGGAPSDALALMNSLRIRPTMVGPEDLREGGLMKRGFTTLVLPYSKGMSEEEAAAIRAFVQQGGLVIADNTPGIYTEHGRELAESRLRDLFPTFEKKNIARVGKGCAAYLPGEINGYLTRMERGDYTGSDSVAALLAEFPHEQAPVELLGPDGLPRRDTFMPVFTNGSTTLIGLLRSAVGPHLEASPTTMRLAAKRHLWDVRTHSYCGYTDALPLNLDLHPRFYAALPANIESLAIAPSKPRVQPGDDFAFIGRVRFSEDSADATQLGQCVHLRVLDPDGRELEHYRRNVAFQGGEFQVTLPVSDSEPAGRYTVEVEHAITGMKATAWVDVAQKGATP